MDCTAWNVIDVKPSKQRIGPFGCSPNTKVFLSRGSKSSSHFYIILPSSRLKSVHSSRLTHAPCSYLEILEDITNRVSEPSYVSHKTKQFKVDIFTKVYEVGLLSIDICSQAKHIHSR